MRLASCQAAYMPCQGALMPPRQLFLLLQICRAHLSFEPGDEALIPASLKAFGRAARRDFLQHIDERHLRPDRGGRADIGQMPAGNTRGGWPLTILISSEGLCLPYQIPWSWLPTPHSDKFPVRCGAEP